MDRSPLLSDKSTLNRSTVCVVIPTYNRAADVERAIFSCLRQTHPVFEVIVVDDGSTDQTEQVVRDLATHDSRVRYVGLATRGGAQGARNVGVKRSNGDWIAFLDSDDELVPTSIETRLRSVGTGAAAPGLVYGDVLIESRGRERLIRYARHYGLVFPWLCRELSLCPYSAMMVRAACFGSVGLPDSALPAWQDDAMVLLIGKEFPLAHCGEAVAIMHAGDGRISSDSRRLAQGCAALVAEYRSDIVKHHGYSRLALWNLRILRARLIARYRETVDATDSPVHSWRLRRVAVSLYCRVLRATVNRLTRFLAPRFHHIYDAHLP